MRNKIPLVLIITLAFFLRTIFLDKIPNAIGGDELTYVVTAKSIFLKWTDLTDTWNPLSIFTFNYPPGEAQAELPYFLLTLIVGPAGFSLFTARILYSILSILSVLLIYLISQKLFSKNVAIFAAIIAAVNPWFIYIGRTNYEVVPAIFFFLLSFYLFLFFKDWKILISLPFLFCAFYSYIGTKLIFLPFAFITLYYCFIANNRKYLKQYLLVFFLTLLLVLFFIFSLKTSAVENRTSQLFLPNNPFVSNEVNLLKKASLDTPFNTFILNKASLYLKMLSTKVLNTFSFNYLFLEGDVFYNIGHGFFYVIDLLFLILGLIFTFTRKRKVFILLASLIVLGAIPQIFNASPILENFAPHFALSFPFLIIFIGAGLAGFYKLLRKKRFFVYLFGLTVLIYFYSIFSFLQLYFFRFPVMGHFDFEVRLMSKYAKTAGNNGQAVTVYSPRYEDEFKKYIFYADLLNKDSQQEIADAIKSKRYEIKNVKFSPCNNQINPLKQKRIVIYNYICGSFDKNYPHLAISRLNDGGESYRIYNDTICQGIQLKGFPKPQISDFAIEGMSKEKFCQAFITSYR